jgi:uncharacterized protein YndB with AHSA1/START domain
MDQLALHMTHVLPAPRPAVFRAFTEPGELAKWWGPRGFEIPSIELEPRTGGSYRFEMQPPEGEAFYLSGEFLDVASPSRLAYTFRWEDPDPDDRENVVTLSFRDLVDESTEVTFAQGPFATEARRALHEQGWTDGFAKLRELLSLSR